MKALPIEIENKWTASLYDAHRERARERERERERETDGIHSDSQMDIIPS